MAMSLGKRREEIVRSGGLQGEPVFNVERKADAGRGQRQPAHGCRDLGGLTPCARAREGRAASREVREEPAHGDRRADRSWRRLIPQHPSPAQGHPPASPSAGRRDKIELGHTRDARQGLTAKPKGTDRTESVGGIFAGSVALAGEPEIGRANAAAIVADPDEIETAAANVNAYGGRSRIDRVFDQLFDHRRWPLDRFPSCYAGCHPNW